MHNSSVRIFALANLVLLVLLVFGAVSVRAEWAKHEFEVMGTVAHVELWHDVAVAPNSKPELLFSLVEHEMRRIELLMSPYVASSEVSIVNREAAHHPVTISKELHQLIAQASTYSALSKGAFDISYASVGETYDYRHGKRPTQDTLDQRLITVDYQSIELSQRDLPSPQYRVRFLKPRMKIDLGGIAKGYAVDRSIAILLAHGVGSAMVSAGGDARYIGNRGTASNTNESIPWMIAIRHPRDKQRHALRLPLTDTAVSTSGDYERFFFDGEERVHHILSPVTGRSASEVVSVTVLGDTSTDCDALSTSVFVMGVEKGLALINQLDNYDAVIIDKAGRVHYSQGMASVE